MKITLVNTIDSKEFVALMDMLQTDSTKWHELFDIRYSTSDFFGTGLHLIDSLVEKVSYDDGLQHVAAFETSNLPDITKISIDGKLHMPVYNPETNDWLYAEIFVVNGKVNGRYDSWYTTDKSLVVEIDSRYNPDLHVIVNDQLRNRQEILDYIINNEALYRNAAKVTFSIDAKANAENYSTYLRTLLENILAGDLLEESPVDFITFIHS